MIWFDVDVGLKGTLLANPVCGAVTAGSEATPPPKRGRTRDPTDPLTPSGSGRWGSRSTFGRPVETNSVHGSVTEPLRGSDRPRGIGGSLGMSRVRYELDWIPKDPWNRGDRCRCRCMFRMSRHRGYWKGGPPGPGPPGMGMGPKGKGKPGLGALADVLEDSSFLRQKRTAL